MGFFSKIKEKLGSGSSADMFEESDQGYVELGNETPRDTKSKLMVRPFVIEEFEDIKPILLDIMHQRMMSITLPQPE